MRILEVRDGFVKIESEEKLELSSFVKVSYFEKSYIAQVLQVNNAGSIFIAYAKLVYLFNGVISAYDKSLPSRDASVENFDFAEVNEAFENKMPVVPCEFVDGNRLKLDRDFLDNLLVSVDNPAYIKNIVTNISKQSVNTVVIDMQGNLGIEALFASKDFKLPLNTASLEFIYEDCLNDATSDSKGLIKEIFADLAEYSKTVSFLPFRVLKTIVDDMVEKSHIFKLLVLKNKLAKFDKQGYFASDKNEVTTLDDILKTGNVVINLSKLDIQFQNRYLEVILSILDKSDSKTKLFVNISNSLNKKNLKTLVLNKKLSAVIMTHSKFKYLNEIKNMFKNFIVEPSFTNNDIFGVYKSLLAAISKGDVLFVGEASLRLPLVIKPVELLDVSPLEASDENSIDNNEQAVESSEQVVDVSDEVPDNTAELSPVEQAVNSKSEELISHLTENVDTESALKENIELFGDEDDAQEADSDNQEMILEGTFASGTEFHTEVDVTTTIKVPEDISEIEDEQLLEADEAAAAAEEQSVEVSDSEPVEMLTVDDSEKTDTIIESDGNLEDIDLIQEEIADKQLEVLEADESGFNVRTDEVQELSAELLEYESEDVDNIDGDSDDFGEIVELDENEISDDDILIDLSEDETPEISDNLDKEIVEDVNKVYTTMKEETISDDDLDFIDELNSDINDVSDETEMSLNGDIEPLDGFMDENDDTEFIEPLEEIGELNETSQDNSEILETRNSTTPIVPVYEAEIPKEDLVVSDPLEQGDTVVHVKYGTGVVEKMIKYGTKTLYSINFDNVGRRLLDPTLTEIKKA